MRAKEGTDPFGPLPGPVGHKGAVNAVAISPDNHWLVTASWDNTARLWDLGAKDPTASTDAMHVLPDW